jgi:VanZ family protein
VTEESAINENKIADTRKYNRVWRYLPLLIWMGFIFFASGDAMSVSNTSRFLRSLMTWFYPSLTDENYRVIQFFIRKFSHFAEYALLALFAVRAFIGSSKNVLRNHWFLSALLLVIVYALLDEFHQSFVSTRTGSIYDSMIDTAGGLTALIIFSWWQRRQQAFKD